MARCDHLHPRQWDIRSHDFSAIVPLIVVKNCKKKINLIAAFIEGSRIYIRWNTKLYYINKTKTLHANVDNWNKFLNRKTLEITFFKKLYDSMWKVYNDKKIMIMNRKSHHQH